MPDLSRHSNWTHSHSIMMMTLDLISACILIDSNPYEELWRPNENKIELVDYIWPLRNHFTIALTSVNICYRYQLDVMYCSHIRMSHMSHSVNLSIAFFYWEWEWGDMSEHNTTKNLTTKLCVTKCKRRLDWFESMMMTMTKWRRNREGEKIRVGDSDGVRMLE